MDAIDDRLRDPQRAVTPGVLAERALVGDYARLALEHPDHCAH
jgi:hypothetical protein